MKYLLDDLFKELEKEAYDHEYHVYSYKQANQVIRKHMERVIGMIEGIEAMANGPRLERTTKLSEIRKTIRHIRNGWYEEDKSR